jgi:uncharacterized membrane protein SpoIIM required for sporulation/uncharacterized RDD family membrane protein YckC
LAAVSPPTGERHALETPERVVVDLDVAGVGHRALAFLVDVGILFLFWIMMVSGMGLATGGDLLGWLGTLEGLLLALLAVAFFAVNWGYALVFEWIWNGQTPGKRLLGLRVMRLDGHPYDFLTSAVRNLTRIVDGLPVNTYLVGLTTASLTREHRRLGDLLAGTFLVKEGRIDLAIYDRPAGAAGAAPPAAGVTSAGGTAAVGTSAGVTSAVLSTGVYETVASYLERAPSLPGPVRARIALTTAGAVAAHLGLPAGERARLEGDPAAAESFLRELVAGGAGPAPTEAGAGRGRAAGGLLAFVSRRREAWTELETRLDGLGRGGMALADLDALDRLYRRATSDLAHARTFYPGTVATAYLNRLTARAYRALYRGAGTSRAQAFRAFWAAGFPAAAWRLRREVALAAALMGFGALAGAALGVADPATAEAFLGEAQMEQVRAGRVWTDDLLSVMPPSLASARIFTNNISVTVVAFVGGLTAGLWTGFVLLLNGGLLGVAFVTTGQYGLAGELLDFVVAHGPVEIFVILLAGGAGLRVGGALVAPGELSRRDALKVRGRDGVRVVLGCAPILVGVGLVEGFVSPGDLFSTGLKATFGLVMLGAFWVYLVRWGRRAAAAEDTGSEASAGPLAATAERASAARMVS